MRDTGARLTIQGIDVEGTCEATAEEAVSELRSVLEPFAKIDLELVHPVDLRVLLSDRMGAAVDCVTAAYGRAVVAPYQQERHAVRAAGIVLTAPTRPPIDATIVLDVDPWTRQTPEDRVMRVYLLGHEFGHVLQQGMGTGLSWERVPGEVRTHASEVRRAAQVMRDEFGADITADTVCKLFLRDDRGLEVHPAHFFGSRFIEAAQELLAALCRFASTDVQGYRVSHVGLDGLYTKAGPLVGELLLVLTHSAALYAAAGDIKPLRDVLDACPGFAEYVADDWQAFVGALASENSAGGESELVRIAEAVLERLGLVIEDTQDGGLYVHVHEPVFCEGLSNNP